MFDTIYQNRKVFITGHTGFKGSWLAFWLEMLGAQVTGFALNPPTEPNHFNLLQFHHLESVQGDIRNQEHLLKALLTCQPDIVFHLAAQPLVRYAYTHPIETYETNIMGTVNLLEACRHCESVKAVIIVTSDKCYENKEWVWGYRENDPMGGYDPYSCSKGCAELVTASYRQCFFNINDYQKTHHVLLASVRAGNVIGGGDWATDRIVPDMVKSAAKHEKVVIRHPNAIRPWQHVLEPLSGYLRLGQLLIEGRKEAADSWNFGPNDDGVMSVRDLAAFFSSYWNAVEFEIAATPSSLHEATFLKLDASKARFYLPWKPVWDRITGIRKTVEWYREFYEQHHVITRAQIQEYMSISDSAGKNETD